MLAVIEFESAVHGHSYLYYSFLEVLNDGDVRYSGLSGWCRYKTGSKYKLKSNKPS